MTHMRGLEGSNLFGLGQSICTLWSRSHATTPDVHECDQTDVAAGRACVLTTELLLCHSTWETPLVQFHTERRGHVWNISERDSQS